MAFINDHVAIVLDQVRHVTFSEEALDESDIDTSRGPPFASSDKSIRPPHPLRPAVCGLELSWRLPKSPQLQELG